ncbi:MAG TPA: carboxypeptidase-like regulatory domain-containing protein [Pyrinomonadaceae bacterium]|nr:carboxypeptidase-like regulatory domain-containing protein [Pyrinomonadaceae bacterium]
MTIYCLLLVLAGAETARACSCAGYTSPCGAYETASAVFVGVVTKAEPPPGWEGDTENAHYAEQTAHVRVERLFKGAPGAAVVLHQPAHNCAPKFKVGERWLLYATHHRKTETWEIMGCGRSTLAVQAPDDLRYLQALPGSSRRTRLSGVLVHYDDDPERGFSPVARIAGARVKVTGAGKSYHAFTDAEGVYELYDLPPGRYTVEPDIPAGLALNFSMPFGGFEGRPDHPVTVELRPKGCAGADFVLKSDKAVGGLVFAPSSAALDRVFLELWPATSPRRFRPPLRLS